MTNLAWSLSVLGTILNMVENQEHSLLPLEQLHEDCSNIMLATEEALRRVTKLNLELEPKRMVDRFSKSPEAYMPLHYIVRNDLYDPMA